MLAESPKLRSSTLRLYDQKTVSQAHNTANGELDQSLNLHPVLVTVLLLWRNTMTKAIYKRKYLIEGLFIISQGDPWPSW